MSNSAMVRLRVHECACHGRNLERFVRPLLLAHLAKDTDGRHGYALLAAMAETQGFAPDASGLYRALRGLEEEGMVTSRPDASEEGPSRRIYAITPDGRACLATWTLTLRAYADEVRRVAAFCEGAR